MSNVSKRIRLLVAGSLLALTALAAGLTMSVVFNAGASAPTATTGNVTEWSADNAVAQVSLDDEDGFDFNFDFDPAGMMANMPQEMQAQMSNMMQGFGMMAGPGDGSEVQGVIAKIENNKITLERSNRVINVSGSTKYGDATNDLSLTDFKAGDRIFVLGKVETDKSLTARWVLKLAALPTLKAGTVSSVDANAKQFKFKVGNDEWTATVTDQTVINKAGAKVDVSKLAANDTVRVVGKADNTAKKIEASRVDAGNATGPGRKGPGVNIQGRGIGGTVKSVDKAKNTLVVTQKVNGTDTDVTVTVDSNTKYTGQNVTSLDNIQAGDQVLVVGERNGNNIKATAIVKSPVNFDRGGKGMGGPFNGMPGGRGGPRGGQNSQPQTSPTPNL